MKLSNAHAYFNGLCCGCNAAINQEDIDPDSLYKKWLCHRCREELEQLPPRYKAVFDRLKQELLCVAGTYFANNRYRCAWKQDSDGNWDTACRQKHVFFEGTPQENRYIFCPYCGSMIQRSQSGVTTDKTQSDGNCKEPAYGEWRTMETAPKDGTCVLLASKIPGYDIAYYDVGLWVPNCGCPGWRAGGNFVRPVAWMPIPEIPVELLKKDKPQ